MKQIPLSRGLFATVDDADFEELSRFKWRSGSKKWKAGYRGKYLGIFANEEEAARCVDRAIVEQATEEERQFLRLNFAEGGDNQ